MVRFILALAGVSLALTTPTVARDAARSFTHEGVTYNYTSSKGDNNTLVLEGTATVGGKFKLEVRNGRVTGFVGNSRVSFLVRDAAKLRDEMLASR